ncbi:MAG TPA: S41 family peptidase, partial [Acidobacteriota bacterium]|nr:S41 family peptidase [Acidobacteriota bacterium]
MRTISRNLMVVSLFLFWLFWSHFLPAQEAAPAPIDAKTQQAIVTDISKLLTENYVYLETAQKMSNRIQERLKSGAYSKLTNPDEFAEAVYNDLESVSNDKHLGFRFAPQRAAEILKNQSKSETETKQAREAELAEGRRENFGFQTVQHLQGNIGYLNLLQFADAADGGEAAIAALTLLSHCDAIIIDLRQNGGGDPTQIQLISSYFFAEPTHLNDLYYRNQDKTENYWTFRYVPGTRLDKADLYILTSKYTFSGAEEFSYNMKSLKRATLIGETTGGGAHPTDPYIVQA